MGLKELLKNESGRLPELGLIPLSFIAMTFLLLGLDYCDKKIGMQHLYKMEHDSVYKERVIQERKIQEQKFDKAWKEAMDGWGKYFLR